MNKYDINPNPKGYFGKYGGQLLPPPIVKIFNNLARSYEKVKKDPSFTKELKHYLKHYVGRPSPIYYAKNLSEKYNGAQIYLKREDLNHTGAHKINHCIGECLFAKRLGYKEVTAETGAGQHGVALATAAALLGMKCKIFMGEIDIKKEAPNVSRMKILGAEVISVTSGGRCLKDAVDAAINYFVTNPEKIFFAIGSVVGPHPYPKMVRDFQRIIGEESKKQIKELTGRHPDHLVACVGGGSNAIGLFSEFLENKNIKIYGVEPAGRSLEKIGEHAATMTLGKPGAIHGMFTYLLQNEKGEPAPVHSVASGLDYPGVGPQHSYLKDTGRINYEIAYDTEAINSFLELSQTEGIIPALESSHALAFATKLAKTRPKNEIILVNLSGRGDKDIDFVLNYIK